MRKKIFLRSKKPERECGGITMEYIIISTFAVLLSISAIGFMGKIFKDRITKMQEKLGVDKSSVENLKIDELFE